MGRSSPHANCLPCFARAQSLHSINCRARINVVNAKNPLTRRRRVPGRDLHANVKPHRTQFGMRKNTASSRRHALRLAVSASPLQSERVSPIVHEERQSYGPTPATLERFHSCLAGSTNEATGGKERRESHLLTVQDVADLLQVPVSWVYEHTRPQCANPLPCMKVGKYLRFLSTDITAYLERRRPIHRVSR